MAPKFRGDSDDWLDNESDSRNKKGASRARKAPAPRAKSLPPEEANATVIEVYPNLCRARMDVDGAELLCSYRRNALIGAASEDMMERSPVAVGDRVQVQQSSPDSGVVEGACRRKNSLARVAPGRESGRVVHVLASNVDTLVIVASVSSPAFSPGLVDRFLVAATAAGIQTLLCINKCDLIDERAKHSGEPPWKPYLDLGYEVLEISAKKGIHLDDLRSRLVSKTVVFCGHSGVGKTSLLRSLLGSDIGKIGEVSHVTGKGKHTTTAAILLQGPENSKWIDTPGVKEFALVGVPPEQLREYFPEFKSLQCQQSNCLHWNEEGCAARATPRYASYHRILDSLLHPEKQNK